MPRNQLENEMHEKINVLMQDGSTGWLVCERKRAEALLERAVPVDYFGQDENGNITARLGVIVELLD